MKSAQDLVGSRSAASIEGEFVDEDVHLHQLCERGNEVQPLDDRKEQGVFVGLGLAAVEPHEPKSQGEPVLADPAVYQTM